METKIIESGSHKYELPILDTITGVGLFHEYASLILEHADDASKVMRSFLSKELNIDETDETKLLEMFLSGDSAFVNIAKFLGRILSVQRLFELTSILLANAKVDDETCDEKGMCSLFRRKPYEVYRALAYAIMMNYGDMLPFLEGDDTEEKHSPEQENVKS